MNLNKGVMDTHLIEVEYYNPNNFDIELKRDFRYFDYIRQNRIPIGPARAILKANDWIVIPHQYYILTSIKGPELFNLIVNMGDQKRKGNKLPSLPVFEKR